MSLSDTSGDPLASSQNWLATLLRPAINSAILGGDAATEIELREQAIRNGRLNGSGPNSPGMARAALTGWYESFFGSPGDPKAGIAPTSGTWPIWAAIAALVALFFWLRRR